ncbi:MFS transporter [Actinomycetospora straminea]|uniref:Glycine betaine/L-proline transporter ProP n=1 Tax=Actinomycetospora straminea TaxID=663607 RepID=A0ABP9EXD4_9PSEU|nr:MFS transporter [Actinomycetospora straminea]MDD7931821.1 MFS transporter [Actinomycetospora straminea]
MSEHPPPRRRGGAARAVEGEYTLRRATAAAAVGNVAEWYDFGIYSYLAVVLSRVFFPDAGPWAAVYTLGAFAAAFVMRPLGGLFFGPLGDRIGRTRVLSATVVLMAAATVLLGLIPSHGAIGAAAPVLVLVMRMLQGFSAGGEYTGALTMVAEYSPDRRRGLFGSWLEFGTLTGYTLGAGVSAAVIALLPDDDLLAWGWRLPFLLALPLGVVGIYLRLRLEDTPAFRQLMERSPALATMPLRRALQILRVRYRRALLVAGGVVVAWNITNYVLTNYIPTYLTSTLAEYGETGAETATSTALQVVVMVAMLAVVTSLGRLSDRVGRRPILMAGSIALVVGGLPAVWLLRQGLAGQLGGLLLIGACLVCFAAVAPSTLPALFPTLVRYGGLALTFNVSVSLVAGTAPTVIAAATTATGNLDWPGYYLVAAGVVGVVSVLFLTESAGRPLAGAAPLTSSADLPPPARDEHGVPLEPPREE